MALSPRTNEGSHGQHVTALFSDLSGYTAMSEILDPEEVKEITGKIFDDISKIISKYEVTLGTDQHWAHPIMAIILCRQKGVKSSGKSVSTVISIFPFPLSLPYKPSGRLTIIVLWSKSIFWIKLATAGTKNSFLSESSGALMT